MQRLLNAVAVAAFVVSAGSVASARPVVTLKLTGYIVNKDANGAEKLAPLNNSPVHPGERIRWELVATNSGDSPAVHLTTPDAISPDTEYEANSAHGLVSPQFSIDGGKTWSARPMVKVQSPSGPVMKPAPTSLYTNVRWTQDSALAPKQTVAYSFEVLVK